MPTTPDAVVATRADATAGRWFSLVILFAGQMLVVGGIAYGYGLLVEPMAAEYHLSRATMNMGLMVLVIGMAAFSPVIGFALDRITGRRIVIGGAVLFSLGCLAVIVSRSLPCMVVAAFCLVASGGAALGPLTCSTLVARSFEDRRGQALGIVSISASVGGFLVVPVMAFLVQSGGWRLAVGAMGMTVLVAVGLPAWCMRSVPPPARALRPSSEVAAAPALLSAIVRTSDFWFITFAVGLTMAVDQVLLVSLVPYGTDRGFSFQASAAIISLISGTAIVGKLIMGVLADRIDSRWLFLGVAALDAAFLQFLRMDPSYSRLLAATAVVGMGFGGTMPLWASLTVNRFGTATLGSVIGVMVPLQMPLNIIGLRYVGQLYDVDKSYGSAYGIMSVVALLAALAILPVRRSVKSTPPRSSELSVVRTYGATRSAK